ncbi:MAG: META domain-containing protein, partial [Tannerellaceae bacterium]|nr:META domain-containing protein [Tannerellaceae bacterium]
MEARTHIRRSLCLCICICLVAAGCGMQKLSADYTGLDGEWSIVELNGEALTSGEINPLLIFDAGAGRISGDAGCNRISGDITFARAEKNGLRFQKIISTRKACIDMRREDQLLKALGDVTGFEKVSRDGYARAIAFHGSDGRRLFVVSQPFIPS